MQSSNGVHHGPNTGAIMRGAVSIAVLLIALIAAICLRRLQGPRDRSTYSGYRVFEGGPPFPYVDPRDVVYTKNPYVSLAPRHSISTRTPNDRPRIWEGLSGDPLSPQPVASQNSHRLEEIPWDVVYLKDPYADVAPLEPCLTQPPYDRPRALEIDSRDQLSPQPGPFRDGVGDPSELRTSSTRASLGQRGSKFRRPSGLLGLSLPGEEGVQTNSKNCIRTFQSGQAVAASFGPYPTRE